MFITAKLTAKSYLVEDGETDADSTDYQKQYQLKRSDVLALPKPSDMKPLIPPKTKVLALYPDTTCFYHGVVVATPVLAYTVVMLTRQEHHKGGYAVRFEEDDDRIQTIPLAFVVPFQNK